MAKSTVYYFVLLPRSRRPKRQESPIGLKDVPRLGQVPLKKELDKFCSERGIKAPSASTIARIIRYLKDKGRIWNPDLKVS